MAETVTTRNGTSHTRTTAASSAPLTQTSGGGGGGGVTTRGGGGIETLPPLQVLILDDDTDTAATNETLDTMRLAIHSARERVDHDRHALYQLEQELNAQQGQFYDACQRAVLQTLGSIETGSEALERSVAIRMVVAFIVSLFTLVWSIVLIINRQTNVSILMLIICVGAFGYGVLHVYRLFRLGAPRRKYISASAHMLQSLLQQQPHGIAAPSTTAVTTPAPLRAQ